MKAPRVFRTEDGDLLVMDRENSFYASRVDGKWVNKVLFDANQMRDDMTRVGEKEALSILEQARKSLNVAIAG